MLTLLGQLGSVEIQASQVKSANAPGHVRGAPALAFRVSQLVTGSIGWLGAVAGASPDRSRIAIVRPRSRVSASTTHSPEVEQRERHEGRCQYTQRND